MSENRNGGDPQPPDTGLPDFSQDPSEGGELPDFAPTSGPVTLGEPSERGRKRNLAVVLSVVGTGVVLLAVIALVLSQTVFRSALDDDDPDQYPTADRTGEGQTEYVPNPEDPDIAPPPPIFTQAPTTECSVPEHGTPESATEPGSIRGGDLQYTLPDRWDFPWGSSSLPYLTEVEGQGRNVEGNWYSVVSLGRVTFPEDEGGYPGLESAAISIFQCYATTAGVLSHFGENPEVTDYSSESIDVDGHQAWIVQATYHFEDPDMLASSSASVVTSIVVEGPEGPSALVSDVAADQPEHVSALEEIIDSLDVVG